MTSANDVRRDEMEEIRAAIAHDDTLLTYFDNLVAVAANYQATLNDIVKEANRGICYSERNTRAVRSCMRIVDLVNVAMEYPADE